MLRLKIFQSTLPAGGATTASRRCSVSPIISIHAPRGGSDQNPSRWYHDRHDFNPRSPRGERRCIGIFGRLLSKFQSTLPAGGATLYRYLWPSALQISIHAPRGGSDVITAVTTSPREISIHAPRGGSDFTCFSNHAPSTDFNPRSPRGERRGFIDLGQSQF